MLDDPTRPVMDDVVELVPLQRTEPPIPARPPVARRHWPAFLLLVMLPTALSGLYFYAFAAPRYMSEARFSISRTAQPGRVPGSGLAIDETPKGFGEDDSFAVRDFLQSRDALHLAIDKAAFRSSLKPAAADPFWAFPSLLRGQGDEDLYLYFRSLVTVDYDSSTGITTLTVEGFSPHQAERLAMVLLDGSEELINKLNLRARGDALRVATAEVARARNEAILAEDRLTAYRNKWAVIDPTALSQTVIAAITALTLQSVEAAAQLDMLVHSQAKSPQIEPLKARLDALRAQVEAERKRLAGSDGSLAPRVAEYERLLLQRDFAAKSFVSALTVLEGVKLDAERQQAFVMRIVTPRQSDKPVYPRPVLWTGGVFVASLILFMLWRAEKPRR